MQHKELAVRHTRSTVDDFVLLRLHVFLPIDDPRIALFAGFFCGYTIINVDGYNREKTEQLLICALLVVLVI